MSPVPRNRYGDPNPYANPFGSLGGSATPFGPRGGSSSTPSTTPSGMPQIPQTPAGGFGGGGFGTLMPPAAGGGGAGGESVDTGGLTSGPDSGGGFGTGNTWNYNPTTNINNRTYNTNRSSYYHGGSQYSSNVDRSRTTNIDNSQTTMGQGQRVQRQKTKAQLNPFQSISPDKEQKMIGDPTNPMTQLRIMRGS